LNTEDHGARHCGDTEDTTMFVQRQDTVEVTEDTTMLVHHFRELRVVACAREEQDGEDLRSWVLKGLFCQWM